MDDKDKSGWQLLREAMEELMLEDSKEKKEENEG